MSLLSQAKFLLKITQTHDIARRYFVVNGFDGALTMLGLIIGFLVSAPADLSLIINACMGAAIALGMSGVSSAYLSEYAERKHALGKLEEAMSSDLQESVHGDAARWMPLLVALVNAIIVALLLAFRLGVYLGRIAGISWIRSGVQTLLVAVVTATLIYLFAGH